MSLQQMTSYYKTRDLNGDEIFKLIKKYPVLYSDLSKYPNLNSLLGPEGYVVVLYQTSSISTGHFVAITRNDNTGRIAYRDSYGIPTPDKEIQFTPYDQKLPKYLTKLLTGVDYESNTVDYQGGKNISDCGRWACLGCLFRNFSVRDFQNLFKSNTGYLSDSDNCATIMTLLSLDNPEHFLTDFATRNSTNYLPKPRLDLGK